MSYGHFDDSTREYVITRPDTPWPWINYLGGEDFFSLVSNAGGGYSFYRDARLRRLTRYRYNDVPLDSNGRLFYVKDGETVWNPGWRPTRTPLDSYECRHGMGSTRIMSRKDGIEAEVLFFVPLGADCEIQRVVLRNTTGARTVPEALRAHRVLSLERAGRHDELPAQPLHGGGRDQGQRDLPPDRVSRATQSLLLLLGEHGGHGLRDGPGELHGPL